MFVINSNQSDAWAHFAINWFLPFKTDWSEYRLFPTKDRNSYNGRCPLCNMSASCINVGPNSASFIASWNETSPYSYYSEYKANDMDDIVTYPEHYIWFCCWSSYEAYWPFLAMISTSINLWCKDPTSWCQTTYSDLDWKLFYRFIWQRKFNCWDIVWKTIEWKLTIWWTDYAWQFYCQWTSYSYVNTCPFWVRMEIWLIHKDATQSPLICRDMELPWWCLYADKYVCICNNCEACWIWNGGYYWCYHLLPWVLDTNWIEAQDWDRLYIEYKTFWWIKMQYWASANNVNISGSWWKDITIWSTTKTYYNCTNCANIYCCLRNYVQYHTSGITQRYEWIWVSVD